MAPDFCTAADAVRSTTLTRLELLFLKEKILEQLKTMPLTKGMLLELPRELRDRIYFFVAMARINDPNNKSELPVSGLSAACKQTKLEFDEIIYSNKIIQIDYYRGPEWKTVDESKAIRAFSNGEVKFLSFRSTSYDTRAALRQQIERDSMWGDIGLEGVMGLITADERGGLYRFRVTEDGLNLILGEKEHEKELREG
ncbi:hypothetical protein DOTSEDRAFT_32520 [Dothistroma septosporum NZE10]|uniref:Uncharacterized protein n=1 Tax=Dothistroma septosporum (strain NZE10 / CBS 128990) TaxID=675120 RepID=N1PXT5_DOTSN|nr:hypothetical protein DOTSEDRAFT_32520 [Dothistroma septosporum NZE10]